MRTIFLLTFIVFTEFLYSQNVGIGTAIPAAKLEVQGDFRLSGSPSNYINFTLPASSQTTNYILPASTGTNGQFLKTDGTGTLSWDGISPNTYTAGEGIDITSSIVKQNQWGSTVKSGITHSVTQFNQYVSYSPSGVPLSITIPTNGTYLILGQGSCNSTSGNNIYMRIIDPVTNIVYGALILGELGAQGGSLSTVASLIANHTLVIQFYSAGSYNINPNNPSYDKETSITLVRLSD